MKIPSVNDLVRIGAAQMEALAALPETIALMNRSLASFAQTIATLDKLVKRLDRLTEPLEMVVPRLQSLVPLLDEDLLRALPSVLEAVGRNAVPALEVIGQTQAQVAAIASSVDRLMGGMDETFARLTDLPGAGLVNRLRGGGADRSPRSAATRDQNAGKQPAAKKPIGGREPAPVHHPSAAKEPIGDREPKGAKESAATRKPINRLSRTGARGVEEARGWTG